ncbi:hypothetical protein MPSEU_000200800 [Mayamaea pseudoterrestris]|nr:hypothetical protein MPSEU_000200800 [Mayamaea pseudoterrestris]
MTMKVVLLSLLLSAPAIRGQSANDVHHESAIRNVALSCRSEVAFYCDAPFMEQSESRALSPWNSPHNVLPPALAHPSRSMLDEMNEFSRMMDSLMDSVLVMPPPCAKRSSTTLLIFPSMLQAPAPDEEERHLDAVANHLVSHLAAHTHPRDLELTSRRVQTHSHAILQTNDDVSLDRRHLARRLTELATPQELQHRRNQQEKQTVLPFDDASNQCLNKLYQRNMLGMPCRDAMNRLRSINDEQQLDEDYQVNDDSGMIIYMLVGCVAPFIIFSIAALVDRRCCSKTNGDKRTPAKTKLQLQANVLRVVYSRPFIKAAIEAELGESIGHDIPNEHVPFRRVNRKIQEDFDSTWYGMWTICNQQIKLMCMLIFIVLMNMPTIMTKLSWMLVSCCLFVMLAPAGLKHESKCCLCNLSPNDAATVNVALSEVCDCCQGTGVCAVDCVGCGDAAATDESNCCDGKDEESETAICSVDVSAEDEDDMSQPLLPKSMQYAEYQGEPIQIV